MKISAIFCSFLMMMSLNTFAKSGSECRDEYTNPQLTCLNPHAGADVRLYITEFQTCKDGKIAELDKSILGMSVLSQSTVDDIHTINASDIAIEYSEKRILIDADNRVDNLSFQLPKSVTMVDGGDTIEMVITDKTAPNFDGSQDKHFIGSFKLVKASGKIKTGKLVCLINR